MQVKAKLKSTAFTKVAKLAGATSVGQLSNLLLAPVLTRIYSPDEFGKYAIFLSFITMVSAVVSWRLELAIVNLKTKQEKADLSIVALCVALLMSVLSSLVYFLLVYFEIGGFGSQVRAYTLLVFITLFSFAFFSIFRFWALQEGDFNNISILEIKKNIGRGVSQVLIGLVSATAFGLIIGESIGRVIGLKKLAQNKLYHIKARWSLISFDYLVAILQKHRDYYKYSVLSSLLNALAVTLPVPIIASMYSTEEAGYFSLVQRCIALPVVVIGNAVADIFHNKVANSTNYSKTFNVTSKALFCMGIVPTIVLFYAGEDVFTYVFGEEWGISGKIASYMALWALGIFCVSPLSRIVFVLKGQKLKLLYDFFATLMMLSAFCITILMNLSFENCVLLLSLVWSVSYLFYFFLLKRIVNKSKL